MQRRKHHIRKRQAEVSGNPAAPVALCFLLGAVLMTAGKYFSLFSPDAVFSLPDGSPRAAVFISCVIFDFAVIFAATSTLGTALIPASAFVCGGFVAYRSVAVISSWGASAAELARRAAVPALLIVPPFFLLACGGMRLSRLLGAGADRSRRTGPAGSFALQAALSVMSASAAFGYICYLLPGITT